MQLTNCLPNSSNAIQPQGERELSIVSPVAGTTRDLVQGQLSLGGYAVNICDTAGIRAIGTEQQDLVEREGIKRAVLR